jgi:hypothetical protein
MTVILKSFLISKHISATKWRYSLPDHSWNAKDNLWQKFCSVVFHFCYLLFLHCWTLSLKKHSDPRVTLQEVTYKCTEIVAWKYLYLLSTDTRPSNNLLWLVFRGEGENHGLRHRRALLQTRLWNNYHTKLEDIRTHSVIVIWLGGIPRRKGVRRKARVWHWTVQHFVAGSNKEKHDSLMQLKSESGWGWLPTMRPRVCSSHVRKVSTLD